MAQAKDGTPLTLGDAKLVVHHADPRRLIVRAQLESICCTFIVLHAPCQGTPVPGQPTPGEKAQTWWDETSHILTKCGTTGLCWLFVDANAPLADTATDLIGPLGAEPTNAAGEALTEFLQAHRLAAPCTFAQYHLGQTQTWTHATGKRSRKDYIFIPAHMLPCVQSSCVDVSHDTTFAHEDHIPVTLICKGWHTPVQPLPRYTWDEEKLLDPARCAAFQDALLTLPIPKWRVAVDDHAAIVENQVLDLGQQFFSRTPSKERKIVLEADTHALIAFKRQALDYGRKNGVIHDSCFRNELKLVEKEVAKLVRRDTQKHYDQVLAQLDAAGEMSNHRLVYRILHRLGRKKGGTPPGPRPLPMLRKPDGTHAQSYNEQQMMWMDQFCAIEAGLPITWPELMRKNEENKETMPAHQVDPAVFPTAWDIQAGLALLKRDKVPGPNNLPPAVMKAGGETLARHLTTLFTKTTAHAAEPLHWKGGRLVPLWKGKAAPDLAHAYRSIFISNYSSKLYRQTVRRHLVNTWEAGIRHLQCGGRRGVGTDVAHHIVQLHQHWATVAKLPTAVLFLDLRSAFYMVLRQTITSVPSNNEAFLAAMEKLGLPLDQVLAMATSAEQEVATEGLSNHLQRVLHDMLTNTHFTIQGIADPCLTTRGTRPGDPVADILFNLCMSKLLTDFHDMMEAAGTLPWLGQASWVADFSEAEPLPSEGYIDVTFVDDCAILVHAKDNHRIPQLIMPIVEAFTAAASKRGLEVNFDKGKTELLWSITGKGARAAKEQVFHSGQCLRWESSAGSYSLHVSHQYKHLGTWTQTKHRHTKEINARASAARQQWGQLARSFFTKKLALATRAQVFQSLVVSKMLYNSHVWTGVKDPEWDKWTNQLRGPIALLMKGVLASARKFNHTTDHLFAWCGILPLTQQVHANRLRFAQRLFKQCPPITWRLMQADDTSGSWTQMLSHSCQWLMRHYDKPHALPATTNLHDWIAHIQLDSYWKGRIKKAARLALHYNMAQAEHAVWQHNFEATLEAAGATLPKDPTVTPGPERWMCDLCTKVFQSTRALAMHASREHGYRKKVRYFVVGDTCPVCCQLFHTRHRLAIHLEKNPKCYDVVQACWPPMPQDQVDSLDAEDKQVEAELRRAGWWASKAFDPAVQTAGPRLPPLHDPACAILYNKMASRRPPDEVAYNYLQGHRVDVDNTTHPGLWWHNSDLPSFILQSPQGVDPGGGAFCMRGLAREAARLHIRALVIVHFFSGYRREGDLHQIVEHAVQTNGDQILVLSVDLCMQRQKADLATHSALVWWKSRAHAGQLISIGGGPPCETYTAARQSDDLGPRPLRSCLEPLGLPGLTAKEWNQIHIGDRLLRFLLDMLLTMAMLGYSGFVEHPQYPTWTKRDDVTSIWCLRATKILRRLNCVTVVSFDQCTCGALGRKPTTLLLVRLSQVRSSLLALGRGGRCDHHRGAHQALIGKQEDGTFQTAKAKIYPYGLNLVLGQAMHAFAVDHCTDKVAAELPDEFAPYTEQFFMDHTEVQRDYHG